MFQLSAICVLAQLLVATTATLDNPLLFNIFYPSGAATGNHNYDLSTAVDVNLGGPARFLGETKVKIPLPINPACINELRRDNHRELYQVVADGKTEGLPTREKLLSFFSHRSLGYPTPGNAGQL